MALAAQQHTSYSVSQKAVKIYKLSLRLPGLC